jgi:hypothetical protein
MVLLSKQFTYFLFPSCPNIIWKVMWRTLLNIIVKITGYVWSQVGLWESLERWPPKPLPPFSLLMCISILYR